MHPTQHRRGRPETRPFADAAFAAELDYTMVPPPRFDRPVGADNIVATSPVTNQRMLNDQEMNSGADQVAGVHDSSHSGGDYSQEQGVGRSPRFRWPWNIHSAAFNLASLDRWNLERSEQGLTDPHSGLNPYVGVPVPPYSPILAMDQLTVYYEREPSEHRFWPTPVSIGGPEPQTWTEAAGVVGG